MTDLQDTVVVHSLGPGCEGQEKEIANDSQPPGLEEVGELPAEAVKVAVKWCQGSNTTLINI